MVNRRSYDITTMDATVNVLATYTIFDRQNPFNL
jgi:hypothetical protein